MITHIYPINMKRTIFGMLLLFLLSTAPGWAQKFCTCQLERVSDKDSDTIIYRAALTVFPEAAVQEVYFGIVQEEQSYYIESDVENRQYVYNASAREVSDPWRSYGRAPNLRSSLLTILSEDLFNVHCHDIYLDNQTHDFTTILSSIPVYHDQDHLGTALR